MNRMAASISVSCPCGSGEDRALPISVRFSVPVRPYTRLIPYSITAVESTPNRKNLIPASFERGSFLRNAAMRNPGALTSSSEMNSISRSRDEGISRQPRNDVRSRK
jgi:hypothetical protein